MFMFWKVWLHGIRAQTRARRSLARRHRLRAADVCTHLDCLEERCLLSVVIQFDYTDDTNSFFAAQATKDLLAQAASAYESEFTNSLSAITPSGGDTWSINFTNPGTGASQTINNPTIAANTVLVYVGGRPFSGSELGSGGPGGYNANGDQNWLNTVAGRGEAGALAATPTAFAPWGGAITFDSSADWFFGSTTTGMTSSQTDFLSVATHELAHVLGFGTSNAFTGHISGTNFTGTNAEASYGGPVPLSVDLSHWASTVTSNGREPVMTPSIGTDIRKTLTPLDIAGLEDIGWTVVQQVRMYRTYNPADEYHFFTISQAEFNFVVNVLHFTDESTNNAGFAVLTGPVANATSIHRLYDPNNGEHYYTTNNAERDFLIAHGWNNENEEGAIYTSQQPGTTEIYMLYNNISGEHLFTESAATMDTILNQFPGIWVQQTSLGYGYAVPAPTASSQPTSAPESATLSPLAAAETSPALPPAAATAVATQPAVAVAPNAPETGPGATSLAAGLAAPATDLTANARLQVQATVAAEGAAPPTPGHTDLATRDLDAIFSSWPTAVN